jgi:hypothetical protein
VTSIRANFHVLLFAALAFGVAQARAAPAPFEPVKPAEWVHGVTRMAFCTPGEIPDAVAAGAQVVHTNINWPYYPLRRDGGAGASDSDAKLLRDAVRACHSKGAKLVLGLPPFPSVDLVKAHPDWRVHTDPSGAAPTADPKENDLGTRLGCNNGPWGDYLIDVCAELLEDYHLDGYSFDGNYHASICYCPACREGYRRDSTREVPDKANLDDVAYRQYLVWRGGRLEDHYRKLQTRLKGMNAKAVVITWSVNAGRYGHLLTSPRAMPARMNRLFDMPMQEWWLDETNLGASVAAPIGAAYVRAVAGYDRPAASEPYLMSRGNPYGNESFPRHEQTVRAMQALTNGSTPAFILSWGGHEQASAPVFEEVRRREPWVIGARPMPWAAMLVSEQTRQFHAYKDIAQRFVPHVYGIFRAAMEEHLPLDLVNDWEVTAATLGRYRVLVLPNAAALSDAQADAVRRHVENGGGLVATCETSLCDEWGGPRNDFALADVLGVHYRGHPASPTGRPALDANFAVVVDENYWKQRDGVGRLTWKDHPLLRDARLEDLVPRKDVIFKGPQVLVSEPQDPASVAVRLKPEGSAEQPAPGVVVRDFGKGRVVYFAAGVDAAMWGYAYPYQRRLLARAIEWAAGEAFPVRVEAPMGVQATFWGQPGHAPRRIVVHLLNGIDSGANHGAPAAEVPLREEAVPVHGIRVRFAGDIPSRCHLEPGGTELRVVREGADAVVTVPPLAIHAMVVGELESAARPPAERP